MLNKRNFQVAEFCSKEESRYTLQGIQVTPNETVATDGHKLVWVSSAPFESKSFPVVQGMTACDTFTPFVLAKETASTVAKSIPKKTTIPVLTCAGICDALTPNEPSTRMIAVTDLQSPQVWQTVPLSGTFPNWQAVMPRWEKATSRITLNAEYLAQIAKFAAQFNDRTHAVTLSFYGEDNAVRFDASDGEGQAMTAVCMPMRADLKPEGVLGTYGYAERVQEAKAYAEMTERIHAEAIRYQEEMSEAFLDAVEDIERTRAKHTVLYPDAATDTPDAWRTVSPDIATIQKGDAASL